MPILFDLLRRLAKPASGSDDSSVDAANEQITVKLHPWYSGVMQMRINMTFYLSIYAFQY